jgi:hypothetical protein
MLASARCKAGRLQQIFFLSGIVILLPAILLSHL